VHDSSRVDYLRRLIAAIHDAISPSVDVNVNVFTYWSLMDNVEWAFGYGSRFGRARVDYDTQAPRVMDSAYAYGEIIRANGLPPSPHAARETGGHSP
jgi:beta-glucosidase